MLETNEERKEKQKKIDEKIKEQRAQRGLTLKELSEKITLLEKKQEEGTKPKEKSFLEQVKDSFCNTLKFDFKL